MFIRLALTATLAGVLIGCEGLPRAGARTPPMAPAAGTMFVSFMDVGQGDAALIRLPGEVEVLVDGGPGAAGAKVAAELREVGVKELDWVVASHPHEDHIGGLIDVLRAVPVKRALDSGYNHGTATQREYLSLLKEREVEGKLARAGEYLELGSGARLEVLAPRLPLFDGTESDANNNSVVARLRFGHTAFLFTGDLEEAGRERLLESTPAELLRAEVLKVAHHGSRNGTDSALLSAVRADYAVISLGRGNEYGHPHEEAVEALRSHGVTVLRTDAGGTVTFASDGRSVKTSSPPSASRPPAMGGVVGNRSSRVYHSRDCNSLPIRNRRQTFLTREDAEKAGYHAHSACIN